MRSLSEYVTLPTKKYVEDTIYPKIGKICTDGFLVLQDPKFKSLTADINGLAVEVNGKVMSGTATCKVLLDLSLANGGQKLSFEPKLDASALTT